MKIKKTAFILATSLYSSISFAQDAEQLFKMGCASCHTIGKGKLVGPDLLDMHKRYEEQWLLKWITSSQRLVKEGDEIAVKLFKDNFYIPMPDAIIKEDQIKSVIGFIKSKSEEIAIANGTQSQRALSHSDIPSLSVVSEPKTVNFFSQFSFTELMLLGLAALMVIVIWILSGIIISLNAKLDQRSEDVIIKNDIA